MNTEHHTPLKTYLTVGFLLIVLTAVTVGVSFIDLGGYNVAIALLIAGTKALLVAFFFMHLLYDSKLYLTIFSTAVIILTAFLILIMFDINTRGDLDQITVEPISKSAVIYQNTQPGPSGNEHH
ncbi:MAG: cytochrome C oxidase subunit IV family protein [Fidelibacterota bacterium]